MLQMTTCFSTLGYTHACNLHIIPEPYRLMDQKLYDTRNPDRIFLGIPG